MIRPTAHPDRDKTLSKMENLCARKEYCVKEIEEKLRALNVLKADIRFIINSLTSENYINHNRYARAFVNDKYRFNSWGRVKIISMLRFKEIDDEVITAALETINEEEYMQTLGRLLTSKKRQLATKDLDAYALKQRLLAHASSHGYTINEINDALEHLEDEMSA